MLNNLYTTVQRAGPVFTGQATLRPGLPEGYHITLQLLPHAFNQNEVGVKVQKTLGGYIRALLREQGWRVKTGRFKKGYFELEVAESKAASSASQKASAIL